MLLWCCVCVCVLEMLTLKCDILFVPSVNVVVAENVVAISFRTLHIISACVQLIMLIALTVTRRFCGIWHDITLIALTVTGRLCSAWPVNVEHLRCMIDNINNVKVLVLTLLGRRSTSLHHYAHQTAVWMYGTIYLTLNHQKPTGTSLTCESCISLAVLNSFFVHCVFNHVVLHLFFLHATQRV